MYKLCKFNLTIYLHSQFKIIKMEKIDFFEIAKAIELINKVNSMDLNELAKQFGEFSDQNMLLPSQAVKDYYNIKLNSDNKDWENKHNKTLIDQFKIIGEDNVEFLQEHFLDLCNLKNLIQVVAKKEDIVLQKK